MRIRNQALILAAVLGADQHQSDIDHWAASTLPKLRDHLAHARGLQQKERRADVSRNP